MQFPTLAVLLVSAGLAAAQNPIGNLHTDGECKSRNYNPVYLDECHNVENVGSIKINAPGFNCYAHKTSGCLDAGKPVKVNEGCHPISEFPDAKGVRCRSL
ncbi:hypothetical protein PG993_007114 [Apiospora rasikravindrae]|uniref:Uncharacterized protein n=1 Tax=Apiospora rasikravindrae TaxID=990691 RepID=A0ABR1SYT8_9PEZI